MKININKKIDFIYSKKIKNYNKFNDMINL